LDTEHYYGNSSYISKTRCLPLKRLNAQFIRDGYFTEPDVQKYMQAALLDKVPLIAYLVSKKLIDSQIMANHASLEFAIPLLDLNAIDLTTLPLSLITTKIDRTASRFAAV
jgi:type IV pilus assembly protein PilB